MKKAIFRLISLALVVLTAFSGFAVFVSAADEWTYADNLPSGITTDKYTVQYRNTYRKISESSPGEGWKDEGYAYTGYKDVGAPYWSDIELPTSETRVLVDYHYYHWCTKNMGTDVNFAPTGAYVHYDWLPKNGVHEVSRNPDYLDGRYYYYALQYDNGAYAYCYSGGTCDGSNGTHGYRSYYWYKNSCYQDRAAVVYRYYSYTGSWTNARDSSASSYTVRYKLNHVHTYSAWKVSAKATEKANGKKYRTCTECGYKQTATVYKAAAALSKTTAVYTGKTVYPALSVKNSKGTALKKGTDYTVSAVTSCKTIGAHKLKITYKGMYSGTKTLSYKIVPGTVGGITKKAKSDSIALKWSALPGSVKYSVYKYSPSAKKYTKLANTSSAAYTVKGLKANTVYYFTVRAYKNVNSTAYTGSMSKLFKTETGGKPGKVTGIKAESITNKGLTLSWKAVSGKGISYNVYWYDTSAKKYKSVGTTAKTKMALESMTADTSYSFAIRAVKKLDGITYSGSLSDRFTAKTAKNLKAPAKVTGVKASPAGKKNNATLKWTAVKNATGYQIFRSTASSSGYAKVATVKTNKYSDTTVDNAKKYYYKIRAYRKNSYQTVYGSFSGVSSVFTYAAYKEHLTYTDFTYSFSNNKSQFHYPDGYRVPYSAYKRMFEPSSAEYLFNLEDDVWGGSCFGMEITSSMMNLYNSGVTVKTFSSTAKRVYDLKYDSRNELNINLTQFIESIHCTFKSDKTMAERNYDLNKIVSEAKAVQTTGKPIIINIYNDDVGHSLIGYGFSRTDDYNSCILVYDCNCVNTEKKIKLKNNSAGRFTSWEYDNSRHYEGTADDGLYNIHSMGYDAYINLWKYRGKLKYYRFDESYKNIAGRSFGDETAPE